MITSTGGAEKSGNIQVFLLDYIDNQGKKGNSSDDHLHAAHAEEIVTRRLVPFEGGGCAQTL